ncbi:SMI1/KNR4 family protein [Streptomyces sp. NPDC055722]
MGATLVEIRQAGQCSTLTGADWLGAAKQLDAAGADSLLALYGVAASAIISSVTDDEVLEAVKARVQEGRPTDLGSRLLTPAPASAEALAEAEGIIGYPLPPLLRRLYAEVANGGFGPFGGIEGLRDGYASDGPSMLEVYLQYDEPGPDPEEQAPPSPPHGVLLICNHGCAMWSMLDCRHPDGQMWWWDQGDRHKCDLTLRDWMSMWLEGKLEHGIPGHLAVEDEESWCWPETDRL